MSEDRLSPLGPAAEFLRDLLQTSAYGVAVVDRQLRYVALNARHAESNARPVADHLSASVEQISPSLAFPLLRLLKDVFETGQVVLGRRLVRDTPQQPGQLLAWSVDAFPVRNAAGAVTAACLLFTSAQEEGAVGLSGRIPERLWTLTKSLPNARSLADVVSLVMGEAVPTTGAVAAGLALLDEDRTALRVLGTTGYDAVTVHTWPTVPLTMPIPATAAVQEGRALFMTWDEVQRQFPEAAVRPTYQRQAHVALPLMHEEVSLGCLTLSFPDRGPFTPAEQTVMTALAETCAQTIMSLRLRDAERAAHLEMQQMTAYLDSVLEHTSNGVSLLDMKLRFVRVNASFAALSGRTVQEHLGKAWGEILPDWHPVTQALAVTRQTTRPSRQRIDKPGPGEGMDWTAQVDVFPVVTSQGSVIALGCQISQVHDPVSLLLPVVQGS